MRRGVSPREEKGGRESVKAGECIWLLARPQTNGRPVLCCGQHDVSGQEEDLFTMSWNSSAIGLVESEFDGGNVSDVLLPQGNLTEVMSSEVTKLPMYCGQTLWDLGRRYRSVHGYMSLVVCVFGSVANVLNIVVLTQRQMASPTNIILTGLAVADLVVMVEYIPFACHLYVHSDRSREQRYTYAWTLFVVFHAHFAQVFHTISIWLTVTLAVWRYISVCLPQKNREWCCTRRALWAVASAYVFPPILCIPSYLSFSINASQQQREDNSTTTIYLMGLSPLAQAHNSLLFNVNFWIYSVVIKLIPCAALTVLSFRLIAALMEAKRRKQNLLTKRVPSGGQKQPVSENKKSSDAQRQTDRTTRMLLAVLFLFLVTEFPQGIMGLLSGILGNRFFNDCYAILGEVMDILALINCAINFFLYCSMSKQFRTTFRELFRPKILNKWVLVPQSDMTTCSTHV